MNKVKLYLRKLEDGELLISVLIMITLLSALGLSAAGLVAEQYKHTAGEEYTQNAELVAEAGIEQTIYQLNASSSFPGYTVPQTFFNNSTQGEGTYTTTITGSSTSKTIISTGDVYQLNNLLTPYATRSIRVTVVSTSSTGYSVYSGPGGLIVGDDGNITNSNVYVGGTVSMNGNGQIGTSSNPVTLNVANDSCPAGPNPGSTYPTVCTTGQQPISFQSNNRIYGTVCATGQTNSGPAEPFSNIQPGNGGAGLEVGCTAAVTTPPTYDRAGQISAVTTTGSGSSDTYVCNDANFNRSWPANLELTGNVTINSLCNVTVNGDVYITGNLDVTDIGQVTVANSLGATRPVIIVDGTITFSGDSGVVTNNSGTGAEFISFANCIGGTNTSCKNGTSEPAATPTGTDLYNSQSMETVNIQDDASFAGAEFDAYWGEVNIAGNGSVGAAIGQTVNLSDAGTLVFGADLASVGGSQTWTITSYQPYYAP